jgi:hypothetical protein
VELWKKKAFVFERPLRQITVDHAGRGVRVLAVPTNWLGLLLEPFTIEGPSYWLNVPTMKRIEVAWAHLLDYSEEQIPDAILEKIQALTTQGFNVGQMWVCWPVAVTVATVAERQRQRDPIVTVQIGQEHYEVGRW